MRTISLYVFGCFLALVMSQSPYLASFPTTFEMAFHASCENGNQYILGRNQTSSTGQTAGLAMLVWNINSNAYNFVDISPYVNALNQTLNSSGASANLVTPSFYTCVNNIVYAIQSVGVGQTTYSYSYTVFDATGSSGSVSTSNGIEGSSNSSNTVTYVALVLGIISLLMGFALFVLMRNLKAKTLNLELSGSFAKA